MSDKTAWKISCHAIGMITKNQDFGGGGLF